MTKEGPPSPALGLPRRQPRTPATSLPPATVALLVAFLLALGCIYSLAWTGSLHFDDRPNLGRLSQIDDHLDALEFLSRTVPGGLGRPVALASFVAQANSWPDPRNFLIVNTFIHLANTMLVFLLALVLARAVNPQSPRNAWFALAVAMCWGASPFLATSSLMIVQRMTTLAASFIFAGLLSYCHGRLLFERRRNAGLMWMAGGLAVGTSLAVLSKENGALLPVFALLMEIFLFRRAAATPARLPVWFQAILLALPTVIILGFLGYRGWQGAGFGGRDFSQTERLLTQTRAIWDYLFNLLIPQASSVTPNTDAFAASRGFLDPPTTALAILGLAALALVIIRSTPRWPLLAFGLAFFFAGHLLESTNLPLEMYFQHRNYVPAFGFYVALMALVIFGFSQARLVAAGVAAYIVIMLAILASATSLWGQPEVARLVWFIDQPHSFRARQNFIQSQLDQGNIGGAMQLIEQGLEIWPEHDTLSIQLLLFCSNDEELNRQRLEAAERALRKPRPISFAAAEQLGLIAGVPEDQTCPSLKPDGVLSLINTAIEHASSFSGRSTQLTLLYAKAHYHGYYDDYEAVRDALEQAYRINPHVDLAVRIALTHTLEGQPQRAQNEIRAILARTEGRSLRNILDRLRLERVLREMPESTRNGSPDPG